MNPRLRRIIHHPITFFVGLILGGLLDAGHADVTVLGPDNAASTTASAQTFTGSNTFSSLTTHSAGLDVVSGKIKASGTAPAVSSCGTSPTIVGSDTAGKLTTGSGPLTNCTITFASAYANAPSCVASTAPNEVIGVVTTTSTAVFGGADITSQVINYICVEGF